MSLDPTGFSKELKVSYDADTEFTFHKLELADKIIFNIRINNIMDTTFDIPSNSKNVINDDSSGTIEPIILVGNHLNLKIQIVATQLSKVFAMYSPKSVILTIASKWFGQELEDGDFDKLMWLLDQVKQFLASN